LRLWEAHAQDPSGIPLDPELFVASQPRSAAFADPWSELTEPTAAGRYMARVKQIIRQLVRELKREVRRAEWLIRRGHDIGMILNVKDGRLSALGCFIVALRAQRADLATQFTPATAALYRACPLYRLASARFIPGNLDQVERFVLDSQPPRAPVAGKIALSLN
jgi:hypothetical protein